MGARGSGPGEHCMSCIVSTFGEIGPYGRRANGLHGAREQSDLVVTTAVTATNQSAQDGPEQEADREGDSDVGRQDLLQQRHSDVLVGCRSRATGGPVQ